MRINTFHFKKENVFNCDFTILHYLLYFISNNISEHKRLLKRNKYFHEINLTDPKPLVCVCVCVCVHTHGWVKDVKMSVSKYIYKSDFISIHRKRIKCK